MLAPYLVLSSLLAMGSFHGRLVLEEGDRQAVYRLDLKEGGLRVEPEEADVYLLVDLESKTVTLVHCKERFYCRVQSEGLRRLMKNGTIDPSWFPWVYRVSSDLVEDLVLRESKERLPGGASAPEPA